MAFINFIETFFFISLAITFILIIMLVYHFKDRLFILEQKCDTMFEILNNVIKEMKNIKQQAIIGLSRNQDPTIRSIPEVQNVVHSQYDDRLDSDSESDDSDVNNSDMNDSEVEDSDMNDSEVDDSDMNDVEITSRVFPGQGGRVDINRDNAGESTFKRIVVEDITTENSSDTQSYDSSDLEEIELECSDEVVAEPKDDAEPKDEMMMKLDYKKLDISVLRAMVTSRGLIEDAKKSKKNELIKMLQQADIDVE